jgi:hypothetical protein
LAEAFQQLRAFVEEHYPAATSATTANGSGDGSAVLVSSHDVKSTSTTTSDPLIMGIRTLENVVLYELPTD